MAAGCDVSAPVPEPSAEWLSIILRGGRLVHVHDPRDIRGPNITKCGMLLRDGWRESPPTYTGDGPDECPRCDKRIDFEEYVHAVGGSLSRDGHGFMDVP